ncbi:MAG: NAD(P)/FAD-dependent oxidoreductase [Thermoanaerobaculia bacterium]
MTEPIDVAIVGAGPAGSSAAAELASAGFSVAVFEKDVFPRPKVCGEFLSAGGRRRLQEWKLAPELDRAGAEEILSGGFYLFDGAFRNFRLPEPATGVSRRLLDTLLADHAGRRGAAMFFSHEVVGVQGDFEGGFAVTTRGPEGEGRFAARAVLAAWGRWSPLDLSFEREFASKKTDRFFGWAQHWEGNSDHLAGRVHLYFFPGGYCGLSRVEGATVNFAGIVSEDRLRGAQGGWQGFTSRLRAFHTPLREHLAPLRPRGEILGSQTVLFERHSTVFENVLAAGDAAGVRDPFTGDGQASAIAGGVAAAQMLGEFLRGEVSSSTLVGRYRALWSRRFGPRFGWDAVFRQLIFSPRLQRLALPFTRPLVSLGFPATRTRIR